MRTNSKDYIENKYPELRRYKCVTSRMYEAKGKAGYLDDWWFKFFVDDLGDNEFIIMAGAKDYENKTFQLFKVPSSFIEANLDNISVDDKGWINLYIHIRSFEELRHPSRLSFAQFAV